MRPLFLLPLLAACATAGTGDQLVGEAARPLALEDADGTLFDLAATDDVVVVDFSAVWCPRCQEAAPELQDLWEARQEDGVSVWTVLFQDNDGNDPDADDLRAWSEAFGLTHPVLADVGEQAWGDWGRGYQPVVFVVDRDDRVVWHGEGPGEREAIEAAIDEAL